MLSQHNISATFCDDQHFSIILLNDSRLAINLIPLINDFAPGALLAIQEEYQTRGILLAHLWADVWISRTQQVLDRIFSLLGLNKRIHGRKTEAVAVHQAEADEFMDKYHIQGAVKSRYKYALKCHGEIVAMATFSSARTMTQYQHEHRSVELIRFAAKSGVTVVGGLTKLITYYRSRHTVHDIMSYADRDWSAGKGYLVAGFLLKEIIDPTELWIDSTNMKRYFNHRLPAHGAAGQPNNFTRAFNTGNLKFVLYL
ncbi:hypothetical protein [Pedobacter duraquae]|uniref:hypothetical protein n=1 Tax=Pedobacter duraquae TaxID=425511 RepID=UPI00105E242C|nr:hypothetical protein [Pedobacter duraquae]